MIYTERDQLTIVRIAKGDDRVSLEELMVVLSEYPSNMVYCEESGILIGIISTGDILRAYKNKQDKVSINKKFISLCRTENISAKTIFNEKKNINALPVVTEDGVLTGDYTRWDDLIALKYEMEFRGDYNADDYNDSYRILLVRPGHIFRDRLRVFEKFKKYLNDQNISVNCIEQWEVQKNLETANMILFVDENELRACKTFLLIKLGENYSGSEQLKTYKNVLESRVGVNDDQVEKYLKKLLDKGIRILGLVGVEGAFGKYLQERMYKRFEAIDKTPIGIPPQGMCKDFFDDLYSEEYSENILNIPYKCEFKGGVLRLKDYKSKYCNVIDGERVTINQPQQFKKSIYFYGPCYVYGHLVEDKNTIESFLQKHICENDKEIRVVNCGCLGYDRNLGYLPRLATTPLKRGDIVVVDRPPLNIEGLDYLDLLTVLEQYNVRIEWLTDSWMHCNHRVNEIYANAIYDALENMLEESVTDQGQMIEKNANYIKFLYLDHYFKKFTFSRYARIGCIVMNSNPFTFGHRYLIEQALKSIDFLIIFVVEEDKSFFSFHERFFMVKKGVEDLDNIFVVPSGPFILSHASFPEYFVKEISEDIKEHTEQDILTFAEKIAPQLGIKFRFVGEEPDDEVTKQYNEAMKKILPEYDVELVEIPRKIVNGKYISASSARRYMKQNKWEKLVDLLPETTRSFLGM